MGTKSGSKPASQSSNDKVGLIAITGLGCRYPGADSPSELWRLLLGATDSITKVPASRHVGGLTRQTTTEGGQYGGFLQHLEGFDANYFGLSPREVAAMDPQHALALEVASEALQDAALSPESIESRRIGVWLGLSNSDFAAAQQAQGKHRDLLETLGAHRSAAAGRLAFGLKLRGPSMVVDTDRSSSLVAIHTACQALRQGECDIAIAGGVNLILGPDVGVALNRAMMLSPDGKCKFCDEHADGIVRSEGAGFVVLQPLEQALREGTRVHAVIRGSAVNSDAGRSGDMMAPSVAAQKELLAAALKNARVNAHDIRYVEAHGTGTPKGDPVEMAALGEVLGKGRESKVPCLVGSIKGHIGHTEAAAGVAGLIKVVLMMQHHQVPATIHIRSVNPAIPLDALRLDIPRLPQSWEASTPLLAGVSSFGLTGTNAHVILEAAPPVQEKTMGAKGSVEREHIVVLSAKSETALEDLTQRWYRDLDAHPQMRHDRWEDIAYTATQRLTRHNHRLAIVANSAAECREALGAYINEGQSPRIVRGAAELADQAKVAFVFPGHGAHWRGMGLGLLKEEPAFRAALEACDAAVFKAAGWSVIDELRASPSTSRLDNIRYIHPAHLSVQIALDALWRSWGVTPSAVVGTSVGEVASVHASGALTIEQAMLVGCTRADLLHRAVGRTALLIVGQTPDAAEALIASYHGDVTIAIMNGPVSTGLAGPIEALEEIYKVAQERNIFVHMLRDAPASHSPYMDPMLPDLYKRLSKLRPRREDVTFYSTVTTDVVPGSNLGVSYWGRNLREQVKFWATLQHMFKAGYNVFVEMSAHPSLWTTIAGGIADGKHKAMVVASLRRNEPERDNMLRAVAKLEVAGVKVDEAKLFSSRARSTTVPTYPWQRSAAVESQQSAAQPVASRPMSKSASAQTVTIPARRNGGPGRLTALLAQLPKASRREAVVQYVRAQVNRLTGHPADRPIALDTGFRDLGMTSIMSVELRSNLQQATGQDFDATLLFNFPNTGALADYLLTRVSVERDAVVNTHTHDASAHSDKIDAPVSVQSEDEAIAVVGMACRVPGASSVAELWQLLIHGVDAVTEIPADRWNIDELYDARREAKGKMVTRQGGFVTNVDRFDHDFFGISPREAEEMDPQQRILMQVAWQALEDAGQGPSNVRGTQTGVFIGMQNNNDYTSRKRLMDNLEGIQAHHSTGHAMSVAAGRIAYYLGTHGPALTIDTACSSSLVAIHQAVQSLRSGESTMAIAGGVNLILSPEMHIAYSRAGMLAPDGRCKSFDKSANGYVRSEGCGVVILKRLSDAQRNHDRVLAVIRGSSVNQDGRSSGLTAPSGPAQEALVRTALARSGVEPQQITYVEAHGTGTPLGDPIEVNALGAVLSQGRPAGAPWHIGSIKSNLGHLEAAAGVAGFIKVVLALQHRQLVPNLHFKEANPMIHFAAANAKVVTSLQPWVAEPRLAGVSSFGVSGTNAHVIVGEAPQPVLPSRAVESPRVLLLSAKTPDALRRLAKEYVAHLSVEGVSLHATLFTAATGRYHFEHRLAIVGESPRVLCAKLQAYLAGDTRAVQTGEALDGQVPSVGFRLNTPHSATMSRLLLATQPAFAAAVADCDNAWPVAQTVPLSDMLCRDGDPISAVVLDGVYAYATACMWQAWGLEPSWVHGVGPSAAAAACVAGVISVQEMCKLLACKNSQERATWAAACATREAITAVLGRDGAAIGPLVRRAAFWLELYESGSGTAVQSWPAGSTPLSVPAGSGLSSADAIDQLSAELASLYVKGLPLNLAAVFAGCPASRVGLPTYPFAETRHWIEEGAAIAVRSTVLASQPLAPTEPFVHDVVIARDNPSYLRDHVVHGRVIAPAALYVDVALEAAQRRFPGQRVELEDVAFMQALELPAGESVHLQVTTTEKDGRVAFRMKVDARVICVGTFVRSGNTAVQVPQLDMQALRDRLQEQATSSIFYRELAQSGIAFGPLFQRVTALHRSQSETLTRLTAEPVPGVPEGRLHPLVLDAAWQALAAPYATGGASAAPCVPIGVDAVRVLTAKLPTQSLAHWRTPLDADVRTADLTLLDAEGNAVAILVGCQFKRASVDAMLRSATPRVPGAWFTQLAWRPKPLQPSALRGQGHWVVVDGEGATGSAVIKCMREVGCTVTTVSFGDHYQRAGEHVTLNVALRDDFSRLLGEVAATAKATARGIVWLSPLRSRSTQDTSAETLRADTARSMQGALHMVQAMVQHGQSEGMKFFLVTSGAQAVRHNDSASLAQASLVGFGRTVRAEYPDTWGGHIDLQDGGTPQGDLLWAELNAVAARSDDIAYRDNVRHAASLEHRPKLAEGQPHTWSKNGTYMVAGGLTGVGLAAAEHLVGRGIESLVLLGRRSPSAEANTKIAAWQAMGRKIHVVQCDVADIAQVRAALKAISGNMPPLRGVLHAAVTLADGILIKQTWEQFERVLSGKMLGAWNLHQATLGMPLDVFVMFSSTAAAFGHPSQGNYAAANSFLDTLAAHRRAQGLPATSIDWGQWSDVGLSAALFKQGDTLWDRRGMGRMDPATAFAAMDLAIGSQEANVVVAPFEWKRLAEALPTATMLDGVAQRVAITPQPINDAPAAVTVTPRLTPPAATPQPAEPVENSVERVTKIVRSVLKMRKEVNVAPRQALKELGLDSLLSLELRNAVAAKFNCQLPATFAFDYPTVEAMARYLDGIAPPLVLDVPAARPSPQDLTQTLAALRSEQAEAAPAPSLSPAPVAVAPAEATKPMPPPEAEPLLQTVTGVLRQVLKLKSEQTVGARMPLKDLGMDSLMSLEFRNALALKLSTSLPATFVFDYPTLEAMVGYLQKNATTAAPPAAAPKPSTEEWLRNAEANYSEAELAKIISEL